MKNEEPTPVGRTKEAQEQNAKLLSDYDYEKYVSALTGFAGQDRQCIRVSRRLDAVRTRVGPRGNFKACMTQLADGRLLIAVARKKQFHVPLLIYESSDLGLTWKEVAQTLVSDNDDREPSLTALPDGSLLLTSENAVGVKRGSRIPICRSTDDGRTWEMDSIEGTDYPRNIVIEADGSLLMVRALSRWLSEEEPGSPNFRLDRSRDGGRRYAWFRSQGKKL